MIIDLYWLLYYRYSERKLTSAEETRNMNLEEENKELRRLLEELRAFHNQKEEAKARYYFNDFWCYCRYHYNVISSPGPKVQVNYCHHLASIVRRLLSVVCKLFTFQASSPKPLGQLEPYLAGMFLGWSSTKIMFIVPVGYSAWLPGPIICSYWLKFQRSSSLKLMN